MRYTGPRNRIARRNNIDLGLKTPGSKSHGRLLKKINIVPGQHGAKSNKKISERGRQLREKQKLRFLFGVTEKQLKNYFNKAIKKKGNTALFLIQFLEKRLDNVIYKLGFAPTKASARQLVNHGHIKVNEKIISIASYEVKKGEIISFGKEITAKIPYIESILNNKDIIVPNWLERTGNLAKIIGEPETQEIAKQVNIREVIEYYSR